MRQSEGGYSEKFLSLLGDVLQDTHLSTSEVLEMAEERCRHSYVALADALNSSTLDLSQVLERCTGQSIRSLCILPVPSYVEKHVGTFCDAFERVVLCDNKKAGRQIGDLAVCTQAELQALASDVDAFLIATSSREVGELFAASTQGRKTISFESFATELALAAGLDSGVDVVDSLLDRIHSAKNPLVVLCGIYLNTYSPTLRALADRGFTLFFVARSSTAWIHAGHLFKLEDLLDFGDVSTVDATNMCRLLERLERGVVFIPGAEDTFIGCSFDCHRSVAAYAYVAALEKLTQMPVLLGLYDVIKPVTKRLDCEAHAVSTYRAMLDAASSITIGANARDAGEFAVNALGVKTPVSAFYRYGVFAEQLMPKRVDGIHLAMVGGGLLSESENPFYPDPAHFRSILDQGIHLHVFSSTRAPALFESDLSDAQQPFFHIHESIADPQRLTFELSQFHAGLILNDTSALIEMIAAHSHRFLRELTYHFLRSMVSSASMLFGCAGLPIVLNRTSSSISTEFPTEYFIPTELSELPDLGQRLRDTDWDRIQVVTRAERHLFSVAENLDRFADQVCDLIATAEFDFAEPTTRRQEINPSSPSSPSTLV